MAWQIIKRNTLLKKDLNLLFNNQIAAIVIPKFFELGECNAAQKKISNLKFKYYIDGNIGKIGIDQYSYNKNEKAKKLYFKEVNNHLKIRKEIFNNKDPVEEILDLFQKAWDKPVRIALEKGRPYYAGHIRTIHSLLLHIDWSPIYAKGWSIEDIQAQLSWNLYIQTPKSGGALIIYNKQWKDTDDKSFLHNSYQNYGYDQTVVKNCDLVNLIPKKGDLILFNTRNYHRVTKAKGKRLTITSFIGLMEDKEIIFWS